jgi:hypothetical protein
MGQLLTFNRLIDEVLKFVERQVIMQKPAEKYSNGVVSDGVVSDGKAIKGE